MFSPMSRKMRRPEPLSWPCSGSTRSTGALNLCSKSSCRTSMNVGSYSDKDYHSSLQLGHLKGVPVVHSRIVQSNGGRMTWASKLAEPYRINNGKKFRLKDFDPASTGHFRSKEHAQELLDQGKAELADLQDKLYAQNRWAVLVILQAMDAAGKDGVIEHVMSGVNPQGCQVFSFKTPSERELQHDFLWRTTLDLPERGHIGIFNRSYYEEVLVVRVHPKILTGEKVPPSLVG